MGKTIIQSITDGAGNRYYIPPRKQYKFDHNLPLRFCIPGTVPSKKNCQIATISKKRMEKLLRWNLNKKVTPELIAQILDVKPYIRNSKRYKEWEEPVIKDLVKQAARWGRAYEEEGLVYPITKATVTIYHYWKDNASRDNSNKSESIHDALVAGGILIDDNHQCLYKTVAEANVYNDMNDHLTIFTITAHAW